MSGGLPETGRPSLAAIEALAARLPPEVLFGTSSWTYPGWKGLIYRRDYPATGAGARQLEEYAHWPLARTVGIDSFFYAPPAPATLKAYAAALPAGFRCVSKVWNQITAYSFVAPHSGGRHGGRNPDWLNADLFTRDVLDPMRLHFGAHLGPLVFEFQAIARRDGVTASDFAGALDRFFARLPNDVPYAVELRNPDYLVPEYFAVLRDHGVAHVLNGWTRMPSIGEQLLLPYAVTAPFMVVRALLRPGRTFAAAVDAFAPYDRIREINHDVRNDLVAVARTAVNLRIPAYVIVNNRVEGCSPLTIAAVAELLLNSVDG
ncbi:MAG TPA: DUF72 domain-containing protein [Gemmatimonadales bacterium]|jgi:uncharacterized protein YecE (DUF72 family)